MKRNPRTWGSRWLAVAAIGVAAAGATGACGAEEESATDDLTSLTARERTLTFEGFVYVEAGASDDEILAAVQRQTRSAFGALTTQNVSVASRELANVDPSTFIQEPVTVVDADTGDTSQAVRVRYLYEDQAIVPKTMARRSSMSLGLLHGTYQDQAKRVLAECTPNTKDDQEMESDVWYVFNPSLSACQRFMSQEQAAIDEAREALTAPKTQISSLERDRLYIPMTARLASVKAAEGSIYPEYDRLFTGGIEKGVLNIALLNGHIDHAEPGKPKPPLNEDSGYWEMLAEMEVLLAERPNLKVVATDPPTDLSTFTIDGKKITGVSFPDFLRWELFDDSWPSGLTAAQKKSLRAAVAERLDDRWIVFEEDVKVKIGKKAEAPLKIRVRLLFGALEETEPYKRAIRENDVMVYNGHSFVGEGPLDPQNFGDADFPESYQLLFIDSCISYNYYDKDYFAFKKRGSRDLDLVVNGLESFSDGSGAAQGRFVASLVGGTQPHYKKLLDVSSTDGTAYAWGKDALRVVDGELDNVYSPKTTKITVTSP